mgnify:FL=1
MKFKAVCNRLPIETRIVVIGLPECETICELGPGTPIPKEVWKADVLQLVPIENGVIKIYIPDKINLTE